MMDSEEYLKKHAKYNPWLAYVLETVPKVKQWLGMTMREIYEELRKRGMPIERNIWNKYGQICRLVKHDFPDKTVDGEVLSPYEYWIRYIHTFKFSEEF